MTTENAPMNGGRKVAKTRGATVLGVTRDGVRILKQPGRATHFTSKELRDAVQLVRASKIPG